MGLRKLIWNGTGAIIVLVLVVGTVMNPVPTDAQSIDELNEELSSKRSSLQEAEKRISKFKEEIQIKKKEARTLNDQIEIIEDNITQISLSIDQTIVEIETTALEIERVDKEIEKRQAEIAHQKEVLGEYIRTIYELSQQSSVTVFLKYETFSEAVNETATLHELQERSHLVLQDIKQLKVELEQQEADLNDFKETLEKLHARQEQQQATLVTNRQSKETILVQTKNQEAKFADMLDEARKAHQAAEAEIKRIDAEIRERLRAQGLDSLPSVGTLDWPVEQIFGISCEFHCSGYPYAYLIGPHSGIDIPTYVGTPVKAPADAYVGRVHNAAGPGYSYILLVHGGNVSTVFGHLSGFAVSEGDMVNRGSVIGYTGGAPGTSGAGLSSGPHLHFEVRVNNNAINPRQYLN